jgi:hypothetical protein
LSVIKSDSSVTAVYPERERQGIFYDEVEGIHPESYINDIVAHEVRTFCFRYICTYSNECLTAIGTMMYTGREKPQRPS